jgi:hypothetical protein
LVVWREVIDSGQRVDTRILNRALPTAMLNRRGQPLMRLRPALTGTGSLRFLLKIELPDADRKPGRLL